MKPITVTCRETLELAPEDIAQQILDVTKWSDFKGFGPILGIKAAEFEVRTPEIVGSRIRVTNTDGSKHIEEIVEWQPAQRIQLHMKDFSAPLSRLATRIEETWEFQRVGAETRVRRNFQMRAKSALTWPVLWMISFLLKRAIDRHLKQLAGASEESLARKNLRQLGQLSLCVLISAPLTYGSYSFLNDYFGERISPWWGMGGSLAFWSLSVGLALQLPKQLPFTKTLLDGIGLGFLTACVNFLLIVGAMFVWVAFFFAS